jgi:hypothetical protein
MSVLRATESHKHNAICDVCGFKFKNTDLRKRWDGYMVCKNDYEIRHALDFYTTKNDTHLLPWTRSDSSGTDVSPTLTNWALDTNGGVASASSTFGTLFAAYAINGLTYGDTALMWADNQPNVRKYIQVSLTAPKLINKIRVIGLQDSYGITPTIDPVVTPTLSTLWGNVDFDVLVRQESTGSYLTVAQVRQNNLVSKEISFGPINTQAIKVEIIKAMASDGLARVVELQVWGI